MKKLEKISDSNKKIDLNSQALIFGGGIKTQRSCYTRTCDGDSLDSLNQIWSDDNKLLDEWTSVYGDPCL